MFLRFARAPGWGIGWQALVATALLLLTVFARVFALDDNIHDRKPIKQMITDWQSDHLRA